MAESCSSSSQSYIDNLVKKKKVTSIVWEHFRLKSITDNKGVHHDKSNPVCLHCHKSVAAKGGNTTNLFTHLRDKHPAIFATSLCPIQSHQEKKNSRQYITMGTKYLPSSAPAIASDKAVAYCIAKNMLPLQVVDKPGFRHMVAKLNPRYSLLSKKHFSEISIPQLYSQVKATYVMPKLDATTYYSATTDLWTSGA